MVGYMYPTVLAINPPYLFINPCWLSMLYNLFCYQSMLAMIFPTCWLVIKKRLPIKIQRYITIFSSMLLVNPTRVMVKAWLIVFQVIHPLVWFLTSKIYPHKNGFMTIPSNIPQLLILIGFISHYTMKSPCELLNISKSDYWPTWV
jgi:hypothetical protein